MAKKEKVAVEFNEAVHGEQLKRLIKDASDNLLQAESYRLKVKETRESAKEELGVDGKVFNKLVALYHKDTRDTFETESEEIVEIYDSIFPK
ncbi:double-stranded DNA binding protein [Erwinia phage FBB1]|nr:double-stranded DNA binding protein [Erwinia phage FBB1]